MIRSANTVVSKKEIVSESALDKIYELLTVDNPAYVQKSRFGSVFGSSVEKELCFVIEDEYGDYVLPRNFVNQHPELFSIDIEHIEFEVYDGFPVKDISRFAFVKDLRDYQDEYYSTIDQTEDDLLLIAPCGHGKTVMGTYQISLWKKRSLILVPEYAIARQWLKTFKDFMPNAKVVLAKPHSFKKMLALIETGDLDIDVLIMSFDLFDARLTKFPPSFSLYFGAVVLDEAHVVGAPTYGHVLDSVPSKHRLALTATFRRSDGMDKILKYHFGKEYKMESRFPPSTVYPIDTQIQVYSFYRRSKFPGNKNSRIENLKLFEDFIEDSGVYVEEVDKDVVMFDIDSAFEYLEDNYTHKEVYPKLEAFLYKIDEYNSKYSVNMADGYIANNIERNTDLLEICKNAIAAGRTVLFLSKRKACLKQFHKHFTDLNYKAALFIGETVNDALLDYMEYEAEIIFATVQKAKQGTDIERLDTLVFHHPMKDIEQAKGRIERLPEKFKNKKSSMVLYPIDKFRPYRFMYNYAYKNCPNAIFKTIVNVDQIKNIINAEERNVKTAIEYDYWKYSIAI